MVEYTKRKKGERKDITEQKKYMYTYLRLAESEWKEFFVELKKNSDMHGDAPLLRVGNCISSRIQFSMSRRFSLSLAAA